MNFSSRFFVSIIIGFCLLTLWSVPNVLVDKKLSDCAYALKSIIEERVNELKNN